MRRILHKNDVFEIIVIISRIHSDDINYNVEDYTSSEEIVKLVHRIIANLLLEIIGGSKKVTCKNARNLRKLYSFQSFIAQVIKIRAIHRQFKIILAKMKINNFR